MAASCVSSSDRLVSVLVRDVAGDAVFGPASVSSELTVQELAGCIRPLGQSARLVLGDRPLAAGDRLGAVVGTSRMAELAVVFGTTYEVVAWGDRTCGGDTSAVDEHLADDVTSVLCNGLAFAALKEGGGVVTWGHPVAGGDSQAVAGQLRSGVASVHGGERGMVAVKHSGELVAWGASLAGEPQPPHLNAGVASVQWNGEQWGILTKEGTVVTWPPRGGEALPSSGVPMQELTSGVVALRGSRGAWAAIKEDGSVVTWGVNKSVESPAGSEKLTSGTACSLFAAGGCLAVLTGNGAVRTWSPAAGCSFFLPTDVVSPEGFASEGAFSSMGHLDGGVLAVAHTEEREYEGAAWAALTDSGEVRTWGHPRFGGDSSSVTSQLSSGVVAVHGSQGAFAAVKASGSVVAWGSPQEGGDAQAVKEQLAGGVVRLQSLGHAFAAWTQAGAVVTWGSPEAGGDSRAVADQLRSGVASVESNGLAAAALKVGGAVVAWGDPDSGGDAGLVAEQLCSGVTAVRGTHRAFAALKEDGSVVAWGSDSFGGDPGAAAPRLAAGVAALHAGARAFVALRACS